MLAVVLSEASTVCFQWWGEELALGGLISFSQHSCDTAAEEIKTGAAECSLGSLLLPVYPLCLSGQKLIFLLLQQ